MSSVNSKLNNLEIEVGAVKIRQEENTQILRALEHRAEIHKAELDNINFKL